MTYNRGINNQLPKRGAILISFMTIFSLIWIISILVLCIGGFISDTFYSETRTWDEIRAARRNK